MLDPHKPKYFDLYWKLAYDAAEESPAVRRKVGAIVVTPTGMISIGWNGTPPGFSNECEDANGDTKPEVIHAERNAIDKMTRQGVPVKGSILFVTCSPCFECAKALQGLGLKAIYYDQKKRRHGLDLLRQVGIPAYQRNEVVESFIWPPLPPLPTQRNDHGQTTNPTGHHHR